MEYQVTYCMLMAYDCLCAIVKADVLRFFFFPISSLKLLRILNSERTTKPDMINLSSLKDQLVNCSYTLVVN